MSEKHLILVVEDDEILAEMLESAIELHRRDYFVLVAASPEDALEVLHDQRAAAIVTELHFHESEMGPEFALALGAAEEPIPHLVLTDALLHEVPRQIKARNVVSKPLEMDSFLRSLDSLVADTEPRPMHGMSPQTFLQVLHQDRQTCTITVTAAGSVGRFYLRQGDLIHAEAGPLSGKEAAFAILSWMSPAVSWTETCNADRTINEALDSILMQWCVRHDHDHCAA